MSDGQGGRRIRLGVMAWLSFVICTSLAVALAVVGLGARRYGQAEQTEVRRADHAAWVEDRAGQLSTQVEVADEAVRDAMVRTRALTPGSDEFDVAVLAQATTSAGTSMLSPRVLGRAAPDGSFAGVALSADASDIGRLSGTPQQWVVSDWAETGQELTLPPRPVLGEVWYQAAVGDPGTVVHSGPGEGQAGTVVFGTSVADAANGGVWLGAAAMSEYSRAISTLFGNAADRRSATLVRSDEDLQVLGAADGAPVAAMRSLAEQVVDDPDKVVTTQVEQDGSSWQVTVGHVFADEPDLLWAAATELPSGVGLPAEFASTAVAAVVAALLAGGLLGWFAVVRPTRRMQDLVMFLPADRRLRVRWRPSPVAELDALASSAEDGAEKANQQLEQLDQQVAELSDVYLAAVRQRADQRRWFAERLHDGALQDVVAAQMATQAGLEVDATLLDDANAKLRRVITELTFDQHRAVELGVALEDLGRSLGEGGDLAVSVSSTGDLDQVDDRTAGVLLRVAKELLVNSRKHSRASRADVTLSSGPGWVRLVVADDGVGYSQDPAHPGGFGLRSIALEVGALGGTMSCESDAGARTVVTIPIDVAAADR